MWTVCDSDKIDDFLLENRINHDFKNDVILYDNTKINNNVILPRYFHRLYPSTHLKFMKDSSFKPCKVDLNFTGTLTNEQHSIISPVINRLANGNNGGIIKARPGFGKTVTSIYIACQYKYKTLIVVDKSLLEDQWKETILQFTNLEEDDIGTIKQKKFEVDKPIIIASARTLIRRIENVKDFYFKIKNAGIDLVFYDECHKTSSAPKFAKVSVLFNTKNLYGLSATPFHNGLHKILMDGCLGQTVTETTTYEMEPEINIITYDSGIANKEFVQKYGGKTTYEKFVNFPTDKIRKRSRYNKLIVESPIYLDLIYKLNKKAVEKDLTTMNIVFTHDQIKHVHEYLKNNDIENRPFHGKQKKLDKEKDKIITATYSYAGDGFDYKMLSCCIIAFPLAGQRSLIQVIGRALRSAKGKAKVYIYILIDIGFRIFIEDIDIVSKVVSKEFHCNVNVIDFNKGDL